MLVNDYSAGWYKELTALPRFASEGRVAFRAGLETMTALLQEMGNPQDAYSCIHVAGTNGKGSTASLLAAIGTSTGRRMGLHTSPHLYDFSERMRIDGFPAPGSWLGGAVKQCMPLFQKHDASFFEATTALSLLYFAARKVDYAIVEVGLGGRLDATNVIQPELSIITSIDLDHTDILGPTIAQIAAEKGGIIKAGIPILTACDATATEVLHKIATERGAPFASIQPRIEIHSSSARGQSITVQSASRTYRDLFLGLAGAHQTRNAALAITAAEQAFADLNYAHVARGLREIVELSGLRARLECIRENPLIVVDVAHNRASLAAALKHVQQYCERTLWVIFAAMTDKAIPSMASALAESGAFVLACGLASPRAAGPVALTRELLHADASVVFGGSVQYAWEYLRCEATEQDAVLVAGSHQLAEQVLPAMALTPPQS